LLYTSCRHRLLYNDYLGFNPATNPRKALALQELLDRQEAKAEAITQAYAGVTKKLQKCVDQAASLLLIEAPAPIAAAISADARLGSEGAAGLAHYSAFQTLLAKSNAALSKSKGIVRATPNLNPPTTPSLASRKPTAPSTPPAGGVLVTAAGSKRKSALAEKAASAGDSAQKRTRRGLLKYTSDLEDNSGGGVGEDGRSEADTDSGSTHGPPTGTRCDTPPSLPVT
jgi:hypothetical protein